MAACHLYAVLAGAMQANIDVLNAAFVDSPFFFTTGVTTVSNNVDWVNSVADYDGEISAAVGSYDLKQLDVFVGFNVLFIPNGVVLGLASPPSVQRAGVGE